MTRAPGANLVVGLMLMMSHPVLANEVKLEFDIPRMSVQEALLHFAQQANLPILIPSKMFSDVRASGLKGEYTVEQALGILFRGTNVRATIDESGQIVVETLTSSASQAGTRGEEEMGENNNKKKRSLLAAVIAGTSAMLNAAPAASQEIDPEDVEAQAFASEIEEIAVTGSRIERPGMTSPVPVTAISSDELNNISPGNLSQALQDIPQFLNNSIAQNRGTFLGAAGQAFLNIRGMGAQRTLVLLNGRRVAPSDRQSNEDVNLFPDAMISRVDVVTGGASAAYGADALAGVANFIVDTQYTGFKTSFQVGQTAYADGDNWEGMISGGTPIGDRMHVIASFEAYHNDDIRGHVSGLDDRDWFENWGWVVNPDWRSSDPAGTNPQRLTLPQVHSANFTPGGKINQPGFSYNGHTFIGDGTETRLYVPGEISDTNATSGGPEYGVANLGQRQNLQSEVDRKNLFINVDYELNDSTILNFQGIAGENAAYYHKINGGLGPSMMGIWAGTIFVENAYLPESIRKAMIDEGLSSFRMEKGGMLPGRDNFQDDLTDGTEISQNMLLVGIDKEFTNGWGMNAYYQRGKSHKHMLLNNLLRLDRWFLAQDAVRHPDTGEIVCNVQLYNPTEEELAASVEGIMVPSPQGPVPVASPIGLDNTVEDCAPLNIFGWGNVSEEAQRYVVSDKWAESYIVQDFAEVVLTGDLLHGRAAGPVGFSMGATYRKEDLYQAAYPRDVDDLGPAMNRPDLGIRGIPGGFENYVPDLHQFATLTTFGGDFDVWEVFGETLIPIYDNGVQRLDFSLAARYADYSLSGGVVAWKTGVDFQVLEDLRLRATLSRDVREATFAERFDQAGGGATINDPVFEGAAFGITTLAGGNPGVKPEEADTYVLGFVYEPSWLPGVGVSADYYNIDLTGAIGQLGFQRIVDDCHAGNTEMCTRIDRNPVNNEITLVTDLFTNIDGAKARGVDVEFTYRTEPNLFQNSAESLSLRFLAGYLAERSETPSGGLRTDFAGSGNFPEYTTTSTLNYSVGPWSLALTHRFIDSIKRNVAWTEGVDVDINTVDAVRWMNMRLAYVHDSSFGTWEVFGNITNLLDEHPPMYANNVGRGLPGGFSTLHHTLAIGRSYVMGLKMDF